MNINQFEKEEIFMCEKYDVVVIGAGPSGSMAAFKLAKDYRVLLVESCDLPRNKSCSGVLIKKSVSMIEELIGTIPDEVKCVPHNTNGIMIINENLEEQNFPDEGINILRDKFDYWLAKKAEERGAILRDSSRVIKISESNSGVELIIKGNVTYTVSAKIVVACDGINGSSRRLTNTEKQDKVITYQKFYKGATDIDPSKFYAYISSEFSQYDAWINTKNNQVVIGTIAKTLLEAKRYHQILIKFLINNKAYQLKEMVKEEAWCLPHVFPNYEVLFRKGKVLFAGEVAGFLNPFGEGISIAMESSIALAEACMKNSIEDLIAIEKSYRSEIESGYEHMKRQWTFLKNFYPTFWDNALLKIEN